MSTEIELKYLITDDNVVDKITALLKREDIHFTQTQHSLANCYFDSSDFLLRKHYIGLRVRTRDEAIEQTIKTSGQVVAGLHQRPEYNITIEQKTPDLSLFPTQVWESIEDFSEEQVSDLQARLISLFSTDFERTTWLIENTNGSKIELVFDLGCITVEGASESICEIELELITGETADLFQLAQLLCEHCSIRPGIKSKAARGYALFEQQKLIQQSQDKTSKSKELTTEPLTINIEPLELIPLKHRYSIEQSFSAGLEFSLNQLQKMIDVYCSQPSLTVLIKITEILALIRHGFWLFQQYLPDEIEAIRADLSKLIKELSWVENATYFQELTDKTGNYRKKLAYSEQLINQLKDEKRRFPDPDSVMQIFYSARFNHIQLALLNLLLQLNQQQREIDEHSKDTLYSFAQEKLEASLTLLMNNLMQHKKLTLNEYLSQQKLLIRSLLTGSWFGSLYPKQQRLEFRDPWLDVKQGMDELHTLLILQQQLANISEEQFEKIHAWFDSKIDSLLLALDCSRKNAMSMTPYWR